MSNDSVCVLIAEDEVLIASMIEAVLADEGLETKVVNTGREAVVALRDKPSGFQVLVTDIRLGSPPEGWEIAHVAREGNPAIGIIYITGDSMDQWRAHGVPESVLISKPFVPAQIVTAVMTLLNAVPPASMP